MRSPIFILIGILLTGSALAGPDSTTFGRPQVNMNTAESTGTGVRGVYAPHAGKFVSIDGGVAFVKCLVPDPNRTGATTTITRQMQAQHTVEANGTPKARIRAQDINGNWSSWSAWGTPGASVNVAAVRTERYKIGGGLGYGCRDYADIKTLSVVVMSVDDIRWGLD
jgi:hypothetical protein